MKTKKLSLAFVTLLAALGALGCAAQNKVLIGQTFVGEARTVKVLMTVPKGSDKDRIVDQYIRICTLKAGQEVDCKDSLVLENVRPGSLY